MRIGELVQFHARHKLLILAHSPAAYLKLGRLVADARAHPLEEVEARYRQAFTTALAVPPTRGRHVNTLQHMAGHVRGTGDDDSRKALEQSITDYQAGSVALEDPVTRIATLAERYKIRYLLAQSYLEIYRHPSSMTSKSPAVRALNAGFN